MELLFPIGLLGFLFLIPLIIIYLRRPKPQRKELPSLMFLMKDELKVQRSMLRRILQNLLFFLQLLALSLLVLAIANPQISLESSTQPGHVVWVLDTSASSQALHDGQTRFSYFIEYIKEHPASSNSLILMSDQPRLLLEREGASALKNALDGLFPTDLQSNLGDSIIAASTLLDRGTGKVVVVSDMIPTIGSDITVAQKTLEARNILVEYVNPLPDGDLDNVGIIGLEFDHNQALVTVKNYNAETVTLSIAINQDENIKSQQDVTLSGGSLEQLAFDTFPGKNTVSLERQDDFPTDNIIYLYNPLDKKASVLYVNEERDGYLMTALYAMPFVEVTVAVPPIIPQGRYDFFIIDRFDREKVLPGTFEEIIDHVDKGSNLVLIANNDLFDTILNDKIPVIIAGKKDKSASLYPATTKYGLQDIDFGTVSTYYDAIIKEEAFLIADTDTSVPLIVLDDSGLGSVLYIGFQESWADFRLSPSFPIFWSRIIKDMASLESIDAYHHSTGSLVQPLDADRAFLSRQGFYDLDGRTLAANLLDEQESDINGQNVYASSRLTDLSGERSISLQIPLMALALIIILLELIIIKFRGDL